MTSRPRRPALRPALRSRRRIVVAGSAVAAVLSVAATQTGAAAACANWIFGSGGGRAQAQRIAQVGAGSPGSVGAGSGSSSASRPASAPSASSVAANAGRSSTRTLAISGNRTLGVASAPFTLTAPAALTKGVPGARVLFVVRGPSAAAVIDDTAPYAVDIDPAALGLAAGRYAVSATLLGPTTRRVTAGLVIARPSTATAPIVPAPKPPAPPKPPTAGPTKPTIEPKPIQPKPTEPKPIQPKPTAQKPTSAPAAGGGALSAEAAEVVRLTNVQRATAGCKALTVDAALTKAAQGHSADMAARNYFSHTSQDGRSPFQRMQAAGYSYRQAAENIAAGQPTPAAVVTGWMNSAGHRANILNCALTEIGVGVARGGSYGIYWTQNFGTPR